MNHGNESKVKERFVRNRLLFRQYVPRGERRVLEIAGTVRLGEIFYMENLERDGLKGGRKGVINWFLEVLCG